MCQNDETSEGVTCTGAGGESGRHRVPHASKVSAWSRFESYCELISMRVHRHLKAFSEKDVVFRVVGRDARLT